mgnify:CR=1 FL=1
MNILITAKFSESFYLLYTCLIILHQRLIIINLVTWKKKNSKTYLQKDTSKPGDENGYNIGTNTGYWKSPSDDVKDQEKDPIKKVHVYLQNILMQILI